MSPTAELGSLFEGLRVIDLGTMVGGPFCATMLGDFGAEVIKVEEPGRGDPMRQLLPRKGGIPLWWKVLSRNKKSVTLDLRQPRGKEIFQDLVAKTDVVVEAFRPGTLERWGIGWDNLSAVNRSLILLRISGFGQTGPLRHRPGFGRFAEAFGGLANITGMPDGQPIHAGVPMADYVSGIMGWAAVASALYHREQSPIREGQCIDLALFESVFRMMEFMIIEYDQLGRVRGRMGNQNPYVAPVNTYQARDGIWVTFTASTQSIVERLFQAIGRTELIDDSRFRTNEDRVRNREELDAIISAWFAKQSLAEVESICDEYQLPFAPILDAEGMMRDSHYRAREDIIEIMDAELGPVRMQGIIPKFSRTPGSVKWAGPRLGEHNNEILGDLLRLSDGDLDSLKSQGVI